MSVPAPAVGIVLPVYNGADYVGEAVASVEHQTSPDWRLLAIDDASTDDSFARLAGITDGRVATHRHATNLGLYATLVEGLARLETEWVVVLMQDDRLRPQYLDEMRRVIAAHPEADGVWTAHETIDAGGVRTGAPTRDTGRTEALAPGPAVWTNALERGCFWTISGSMTRRRILEREPFRTDLPHCGDLDWLLRAGRTATLLYYERPLIEIREHAGQASARHMREGRHLAETRRVIDANLSAHPGDIGVWSVCRIGAYRAGQAVRNLLGNLGRGRVRGAANLAATACRFLWLPVAFSVQRGRHRT